jgi:hypothetical protein
LRAFWGKKIKYRTSSTWLLLLVVRFRRRT